MAASQELELPEGERFFRIEWRVQRVGWIVWGLIVVAALAGLVGTGPLSSREVSASDGSLVVGYDRFLHYHTPSTIELTLPSMPGDSNPFRVQLSRALLEGVEISRIEPEPEGRTLAADGVVYDFPRGDGIANARILLHLKYERFGRHGGEIALVGHEPVTLSQFVYP
jgi:hypothetical protein